MKLKKLLLVGFKTFADKTEIEFGDGLTAVVGPNGCGKSNIADALLWVLGEQNPRLLRGSDNRDFIFAGSDSRKPVGMAEVRLTVDNSDGGLRLDAAEVCVARRVYRSGDSQYLLNGAACRLRDIVDLFLDTGMGNGAYSFVGQTEVDAVLSARGEDRRELFEEAAGVKKYRVRKREAMRKLEHAEANLTRIADIVSELESQREPLRLQAEVAQRYLELSERLRTIEVDLLISELHRSDYELYAARRDRELGLQSVQDYDASLALMEREADAIRERLGEAERELDAARLSQQSALTVVERAEHQLQLVTERGQRAEETSEAFGTELRSLAAREASLLKESAAQEAGLARLRASEAAQGASWQAAKARLKGLEDDWARAARSSEEAREIARREAEKRAYANAALTACRERLAECETRIARALTAVAGHVAGTSDAERRAERAMSDAATARQGARSAEALRAELEQARRNALDRESAAQTAADGAHRRLAECESRLATLEESRAAGEGYYQGVRSVIEASRSGRLSGEYRVVADAIRVPPDLRVAIEVALGQAAQAVICQSDADANAAIDLLKKTRGGRATFLPLASLRPLTPVSVGRSATGAGIVGVASELVTAEPSDERAVSLLLGRVVVARSLDHALHASRQLSGWSRIVTLDGELVTPGGALTGGSLQGRGAHLIDRAGEIDDLRRRAPALRTDADEHRRSSEAARAEAASLSDRIREAGEVIAAHVASAAAADRDAQAAVGEAARAQAAADEAEAERVRSVAARDALAAEAESWSAALSATGSGHDAAASEPEVVQRETDRLAELRDEARRQAVELEVDVGRLAEKRAGAERMLEATRRAVADTRAARAEKQSHREASSGTSAESHRVAEELRRELEIGRRRLAECEERFAHWRDARQRLLQASFDRAASIKEMNQQRGRTMTDTHDAELRIARGEVRQSQLAQRLTEEYGISPEQGLAMADPGVVDRETVNEIARLRRDLRAMGSVNTGAVEEYGRLTERHDFLSVQRTDLEGARGSLRQTITEIDEATRGVFMSTFAAVSSEFQKLFVRLFGGGVARLELTDPDDVLETGIDIHVQPPGKKLQHLSLLSGGERSLTALALLFSFLSVKPSPFVVLDEVDAALDGENVEKFAWLLDDFSAGSQFVAITHNPTTIEHAQRWFGVTIERGVSRVLSYRVPGPAPDGEGGAVEAAA